jgi:hypothetical protein
VAVLALAWWQLMPPEWLVRAGMAHYRGRAYIAYRYSDVLALWAPRALASHGNPYGAVSVEYPVVTGVYMWLCALAGGVRAYWTTTALGLTACAVISVGCLASQRRLRWSWLALLPLLAVYGLINWDLLAISLMLAGWVAERRGAYRLAGTLLALGLWAKLFPVFLGFFLAWRLWQRGERDRFWSLVKASGVVTVAVNGPFALVDFVGWARFLGFNAGRSDVATLMHLVLPSGSPVAMVDIIGILVVGATTVLLARRCPEILSPERAALVLFAVFLLVNKVYSPQYTLWLAVFAILADLPGWTFWLMAVGGVTDYLNSMEILRLAALHSPGLRAYHLGLFHDGLLLRYAMVAIVAAVGWWPLWRRRGQSTRGHIGVDIGVDGDGVGVPIDKWRALPSRVPPD